MSLSVKKGDTVVVIAGKDKKKVGKVNLVNPKQKRVVVEGVNMIVKHQKPKSAQDKGGIVKKEGTIDISNVQVICPSCNKATRVAHTVVEGKKVRVCKHCGASLDTEKKVAKKAPAKKTSSAKKPQESK
jgi:large subunit ribosomal protein L24